MCTGRPQLEQTLFARSPRESHETRIGVGGSSSSSSSSDSGVVRSEACAETRDWCDGDNNGGKAVSLGSPSVRGVDLERRLKGLSASCKGERGLGEVERVRAEHAATQDALAAQTLEFHAFKHESQGQIWQLKRQAAEARERESRTKKEKQDSSEAMKKQLQALNKDLVAARESQATWLQEKAKLEARLTAQTASIASLKAKIDSLQRADSNSDSGKQHFGAELADANKRLDLALLSVNGEQERANTAEFALLHEKEERRRCLKELDSELARIADACESSVQRLILSLARSLQPLVAERDLRDAAFRLQSAGRSRGLSAPELAAATEAHNAVGVTDTSSAASSCSGSFREPSRGDGDGTSSSFTGRDESEALRAQLSKMEEELRSVKVQKQMLESMRVAGGIPALGLGHTCSKCGVSERILGVIASNGEAHASEGLASQLHAAEAGLRDVAAQKQVLSGLDLESLSREHDVSFRSFAEWDVKFQFDDNVCVENMRNKSALAAVEVGLRTIVRDLGFGQDDMAEAAASIASEFETMQDSLDQSIRQVRMAQAALREAQLAPNRAATASENVAKSAAEISRLQRILEHVRKAGVEVQEVPYDAGDDSQRVAAHVLLPRSATPLQSESHHASKQDGEQNEDQKASKEDREEDGEGVDVRAGSRNLQESSTKAAIRRSRERRSLSPVPAPPSEEVLKSAGEAGANDEVEADGSGGGGVVEESNPNSVRAQVSLLQSMFGASADSRRSSKAEGASAGAHTKQTTGATMSAPADDAEDDVKESCGGGGDLAVAHVMASRAKSGDLAAVDGGVTDDAAAGKEDRRREVDGALKPAPTLPEYDEEDVPEMEETYPIPKLAHALFPYSPQEEDELEVTAGAALYVLGVSQPDWLVAVKAGTAPADIGLIPENYIKITEFAGPHGQPGVGEDDEGAGKGTERAASSTESSPLPTPKFDAALISQLNSATTGSPDYLDTPTGPPIFSRSATRAFDLDPGGGRQDGKDPIAEPSSGAENVASGDNFKTDPAIGASGAERTGAAGSSALMSQTAALDDATVTASSSPLSSSVDMDDLIEDMYSGSGAKGGESFAAGGGGGGGGAAAPAVASPSAQAAGARGTSASSSTSEPVTLGVEKAPASKTETEFTQEERVALSVGNPRVGCPEYNEEDLPEMEERYQSVKEAKALYKYAAQEDDELSVHAGETLYVLGVSQPDWLVAVRSGTAPADVGLIPENYIQMQS